MHPVDPTISAIVSDGSPLPPPISSTFWPIPIRASSTRAAVNGANICAISVRYFSQYRAEVCHASSLCCSGFIFFISIGEGLRRSFAVKGQVYETFWRTKDGSANRRLWDRSPSPEAERPPRAICSADVRRNRKPSSHSHADY